MQGSFDSVLVFKRMMPGGQEINRRVKDPIISDDAEGVDVDSVTPQIDATIDAVKKHPQYKTEIKNIFKARMERLREEENDVFLKIVSAVGVDQALGEITQYHYEYLVAGRERRAGLVNLIYGPPDEYSETPALIDEISKRKDFIFQQMIADGKIKAFPESLERKRLLHEEMELPVVTASGSTNTPWMMHKAGFSPYVDAIVCPGRGQHKGNFVIYLPKENPKTQRVEHGDGSSHEELDDSEFIELREPIIDAKMFQAKPRPDIFIAAAKVGEFLRLVQQNRELAQLINEGAVSFPSALYEDKRFNEVRGKAIALDLKRIVTTEDSKEVAGYCVDNAEKFGTAPKELQRPFHDLFGAMIFINTSRASEDHLPTYVTMIAQDPEEFLKQTQDAMNAGIDWIASCSQGSFSQFGEGAPTLFAPHAIPHPALLRMNTVHSFGNLLAAAVPPEGTPAPHLPGRG